MRPSTIDFEHEPGSPLVGRVLLAVGLAVAAGAGWQHQIRAEAIAARVAAVTARETVRQQAAERARKTTVPPIEERQQVAARALLNQPWLPVLRAVEGATQAPLYVLSLSLDAGTGRLQIEGVAPSFQEVVAYVDSLATEPLIVGPRLLSQERVPATAGAGDVRFQVSAGWNAR